ncbi:MAG: hypothetical protein JM58_12870 [Peptococcaceae bacterium BICA1-8]|nr:MAG: hypothetical protein JM58_12870 [Peptococcaceae bacterium BICA1-8]
MKNHWTSIINIAKDVAFVTPYVLKKQYREMTKAKSCYQTLISVPNVGFANPIVRIMQFL